MSDLATQIISGDRRALAKAITLIESHLPEDQDQALKLLAEVHSKTDSNAIRIGVSGVPGAGKSTLIEKLGLHLVRDLNLKVAVLAIDPSSPVSGGSLLGDKTRMEELTQEENAFIRPSPTKGTMGGLGVSTREAMLLCEAAGFDVIIVETVGVGQSEYQVRDLVDIFLLLGVPNAGDELQGIKKGIMELADLVAINKCDLDPQGAELSAKQVESALSIITSSSYCEPKVQLLSALDPGKVKELWQNVDSQLSSLKSSGDFEKQRGLQAKSGLRDKVEFLILQKVRADESLTKEIETFNGNIFEKASEVSQRWGKK